MIPSLIRPQSPPSVKVKNLRERERVERGSILLAWPFPAHCWDGGKHKTSLNSTNPSLREEYLALDPGSCLGRSERLGEDSGREKEP